MSFQLAQGLAGGRVPDADGVVIASRGEAGAVGRKRDGIDRERMSLQHQRLVDPAVWRGRLGRVRRREVRRLRSRRAGRHRVRHSMRHLHIADPHLCVAAEQASLAVTEIGTQFVCIVLSGAILFILLVERAEPRAQFVGQRSGTSWPTNGDQALESTAIVSSVFEITSKR